MWKEAHRTEFKLLIAEWVYKRPTSSRSVNGAAVMILNDKGVKESGLFPMSIINHPTISGLPQI